MVVFIIKNNKKEENIMKKYKIKELFFFKKAKNLKKILTSEKVKKFVKELSKSYKNLMDTFDVTK